MLARQFGTHISTIQYIQKEYGYSNKQSGPYPFRTSEVMTSSMIVRDSFSLLSWRSRIFASIVPDATKRYTKHGRSWPKRYDRHIACVGREGSDHTPALRTYATYTRTRTHTHRHTLAHTHRHARRYRHKQQTVRTLACLSCDGFQHTSNRMTRLPPTRFTPSAPARVDISITFVLSFGLLKRCKKAYVSNCVADDVIETKQSRMHQVTIASEYAK